MHLESLENQVVKINGANINFSKDETIHTENSYKYSLEEFEDLISDFYELNKYWTDDSDNFAVCYFRAK